MRYKLITGYIYTAMAIAGLSICYAAANILILLKVVETAGVSTLTGILALSAVITVLAAYAVYIYGGDME